jgi:amino acid transporter
MITRFSANPTVEVVAAAIIIEYWDTKTNPAAYITIFIFVIWAVNFMGARAYGETEFWASIIKVLTITGLIILSLVLMCGGGPDKDAIGFRYWRNPGPFNQMKAGDGFVGGRWGQFLAFWNVFVQAAFSFIGTEIIGTTLGEAENPRRTVPRAIKRVFWRLVIFYVLGTFFISVLVPYNDPTLMGGGDDASASPFVIAINRAGIKGLPSVVNAAILTSAISAGVSDLYASSRTLYALALQRQAPAIFRYCTKQGLPLWCVVATGLFGFLAYLNTGGATAIEAFNYLYALAAITGILAWWAILLSYLRFFYGLKKQGLTRDSHPYKAPFQPYLSWFGFISFNLILLFNGFPVFIKGNWETSTFITAYIGIIIFIGSFVFWKLLKRTKWVRLEDIDFMSGRRALDAMEAADAERFKPETTAQKISSWLF